MLLNMEPAIFLQGWTLYWRPLIEGSVLVGVPSPISWLFVAISIFLLIPIVVLWIECFAALFPYRTTTQRTILVRPRIYVLMPAHNESTGIEATLKTILPQLIEGDRLVVIADNCEDETAEIARAAGAIVTKRYDPERRGKGYAIDHGLRFIATDPPEVVVLVDADCTVHPGTLEQISCLAMAMTRPVQALYLLDQPANPGPREAVSSLAFMVKNLVRPRGLDRIGLPCLLTGTGMAFPWSVISAVSLGSSNIVEDMQLAVDLAIAGYPAKFCSDGQVTGLLPQRQQAAETQRTRWEHGHLKTLLTQVPRLLKEAMLQGRVDLLALALDLSVPPLSLLVMLWVFLTAVSLIIGILKISSLPTSLMGATGLLLGSAIAGVWTKFGRNSFPIQTLLAIPLYILWKIPLYLTFLIRPQTQWIRTERDDINSPKT